MAPYFPTVKGCDFTCQNGNMPLPNFSVVCKGEFVKEEVGGLIPTVKSPLYLIENLPGGQLLPVL